MPGPIRHHLASRRLRGAVALAASVLALHGWLLAEVGGGGVQRGPRAPALQARRVLLVPQAVAVAAPGEARPAAPAVPPPAAAATPKSEVPAPSRTPMPPPTAQTDAPVPPAAAPALLSAGTDLALPPGLRQPKPSDIAAAAAVHEGGEPLPLYPTLLPPPALLRYALRFGGLSGEAQLLWRPDGERYELSLEGALLGRVWIAQRSTGALDDAGLAPERFTDQRRGRSTQAANFQREGRRVTFSGPRVDYLLPPGAQDRLSLLAQLAGIVAARAQTPPAGERLTLYVVDARGAAGAWRFVVLGEEELEGPGGVVRTLHLRREPRHDEDAALDLWLDPARGGWPLRLRQGRPRGGDGHELVLQAVLPAP